MEIDCQFNIDTHIAKVINIINRIHTFPHFNKYSFILDILKRFAKNIIITNNNHNRSLHIEIRICDSHHIIQYHNTVTIIWYIAVSTKNQTMNFFTKFCIKLSWKKVNLYYIISRLDVYCYCELVKQSIYIMLLNIRLLRSSQWQQSSNHIIISFKKNNEK